MELPGNPAAKSLPPYVESPPPTPPIAMVRGSPAPRGAGGIRRTRQERNRIEKLTASHAGRLDNAKVGAGSHERPPTFQHTFLNRRLYIRYKNTQRSSPPPCPSFTGASPTASSAKQPQPSSAPRRTKRTNQPPPYPAQRSHEPASTQNRQHPKPPDNSAEHPGDDREE